MERNPRRPASESFIGQLARGLVGDGEAGRELQKTLDERLVPNVDARQFERTFLGTVAEIAALTGTPAAAEPEGPGRPPMFVRERELQDGSTAVRVLVDDTDATHYVGAEEMLLRGDGWEQRVYLGFEAARVERNPVGDGGGMTEFVAYPAAPIETDHPPEDDENDDDESDDDESDVVDEPGEAPDPVDVPGEDE